MKVRLRNRGQVSLEYATTYAWAILIMMVIVGSLLYFGAIETERNSETICSLGPQFKCQDVYITADGGFGMRFFNNVNDNISMNVSLKNFPASSCSVNPDEIGAGKEGIIICSMGDEVYEGDLEVIETTSTYITRNGVDDAGSRTTFIVQGKITTNVEKNLVDKKDICDQDRDDFWSDEEYCGGIDCDDSNPSIQTPRCYADFSEDPDGGCNRRRQYCHDAGECYSSCRWLPELECPPLPWWMCDFP